MSHASPRVRSGACALLAATLVLAVHGTRADAASSKGCEGGAFVITNLADGSTVAPAVAGGALDTSIPAARLGPAFLVKGRYIEFTVVSASFGVNAFTFTGAPNPLDMTGGRRTVAFASKTPDHRGLVLTSAVGVEIDGPDLVIDRTGRGLGMKVQAKDCANGGIFQMEPQRGDGTATVFTHTLADGMFYFDNPNFRAREGDVVPFKETTVTVATRVNFTNNVSPRFVGRDSPQVATRIANPACANAFVSRVRGPEVVNHCGGVSQWSVASGGRMGQVMGEDSTEVAPPPTTCTHQCQAQNRVRGQAVVLGFPFPVPAASILQPRFP